MVFKETHHINLILVLEAQSKFMCNNEIVLTSLSVYFLHGDGTPFSVLSTETVIGH